jgi:hypothetical protein
LFFKRSPSLLLPIRNNYGYQWHRLVEGTLKTLTVHTGTTLGHSHTGWGATSAIAKRGIKWIAVEGHCRGWVSHLAVERIFYWLHLKSI